MKLEERTLERSTVFKGKILEIQVDRVELPNGHTSIREVARHPGGVAILPLDGEGNVTLVRQFRYPFAKVILELPAGKLDGPEDHRLAAERELSEETGLVAGKYTYMGAILASPGFCDERLHMYLAQELSQKESHPDEDEFLNVVKMPFGQLVEQVMKGEVEDAKTVAATLKAKELLNR